MKDLPRTANQIAQIGSSSVSSLSSRVVISGFRELSGHICVLTANGLSDFSPFPDERDRQKAKARLSLSFPNEQASSRQDYLQNLWNVI